MTRAQARREFHSLRHEAESASARLWLAWFAGVLAAAWLAREAVELWWSW